MTRDFVILGKNFIVTNEMYQYNLLRERFFKMAERARDSFIDIYESENSSIEDVIKNFENQAIISISPCIDFCVKTLVDHSVYNVDREGFIVNYFLNYNTLSEDFSQVVERYFQIINDQKTMEAYREARRQSRGRVVGGGFGFKGAVKGMATAGTINLATGIAHSFFNGIGNMLSDSKAAGEKLRLFNDPRTLNHLADSVLRNAYFLQIALIDAISSLARDNTYRQFYSYDKAKADAIFNNIVNQRFSRNQKIDLLISVLSTYPYEKSYYDFILRSYGDENKQLEELALFFGINLLPSKIEIVENQVKGFNISDINDANHAIDSLNKLRNKLGLNKDDIEEFLDDIRNKYEKVEKRSRTANGVVLDSKNEIEEYRKFVNSQINSFKEYVIECYKQLSNENIKKYTFIFSEKDAEKKIENAIQKYCTYRKLDEDSLMSGEEQGLFLYDDTIFGSGKAGFLITNKKLYMSNKWQIDLSDIKDLRIEIEGSLRKLVINNEKASKFSLTFIKQEDIEEMTTILKNVILGYKSEAQKSVTEILKINAHNEEEKRLTSEITRLFSLLKCKNDISHTTYIYDETNLDTMKKFKNAMNDYAKVDKDEKVFMLYDPYDGIRGAVIGIVFTNKFIYSKGMFDNINKIDINSIVDVIVDKENHTIYMKNKKGVTTKIIEMLITKGSTCDEISGFLMDVINLIKKENGVAVSEEKRDHFSEKVDDGSEDLDIISYTNNKLQSLSMYSSIKNNCFVNDGSSNFQYRLGGAKEKFAREISLSEQVILLFDCTMLGSGKDGFLLTDENIYAKNSIDSVRIPLEIIKEIGTKRYIGVSYLVVLTTDGGKYDSIPIMAVPKNNLSEFEEFMKEIIAKTDEFKASIENLEGDNFEEQYHHCIDKGNQLLKQKNFKMALTYFDKAIVLNNKDYEAYEGKGIALARLEMDEEAIQCFNKAREILQTSINYYIGLQDNSKQNNSSIIEDYIYDLSFNTKLAGISYMYLGKYSQAYSCFDQMDYISPFSERMKAKCKYKLGEYERALDILHSLLDKNEFEFDEDDIMLVFELLGDIYGIIGQLSTSIEYYDKILEYEPNNKGIKEKRKEILLKYGN